MKRASRLGLILWLAASVAAPAIGVEVVKPARVGYVWIGSRGTDTSTSDAGLHQGFTDKGYVIGRDLLLEERYADGHPERVAALVAELVALPVDVLMTPGTPITKTAQGATSTIPIVSVSGDPVGTGLVASLSRPGGNITGLSLLSGEYSVKWLELLREAVPTAHRVGVLWNPDNPGVARQLDRLQQRAPGRDVTLAIFSARPADLDASLVAIATAGLDGLVISDDPFLETIEPRLIALAADRRLPTLYSFSSSVRRGGLMSYSETRAEVGRPSGFGASPNHGPSRSPAAVRAEARASWAQGIHRHSRRDEWA